MSSLIGARRHNDSVSNLRTQSSLHSLNGSHIVAVAEAGPLDSDGGRFDIASGSEAEKAKQLAFLYASHIQTARETEGELHGRVAITQQITEGIVSQCFNDIAAGVADRFERPHLIVMQVVDRAFVAHPVGHSALGVLEADLEIVVLVIDRQQCGQVNIPIEDDGNELKGTVDTDT
jgi:hypothetical protein